MTRFARRALAFFALLSAAACATAPQAAYHARADGNTGYYDEKLAANKYFILYTDTKRGALENYIRLRAAEVAVAQGFPNFVLVRSGVRQGARTQTNFRAWSDMGTAAQLSANVNNYLPKTTDQLKYSVFDAYGEIELLTAEQARGRSEVLDARAVIASGGA
jgi:hypothetical protein